MYRVDVTHKGDHLFEVKSKDSTVMIDTKGKGMTPPDALLASLASCIGVYIRKYAESTKIDIKDFTISAQAELTTAAPICFKSISVAIDLHGTELEESRKQSLLRFIHNCPVHNTIIANPVVDMKLV
ncbi:MAG TPA: OsmC family protein [Candidatus Omnitrophota bacterium]|nr:OsmC family protein [Candidatus Omnitrophota bacterium]HPT07931.1 OsmC family protein [Candidatus Omnitrophota bacterium]